MKLSRSWALFHDRHGQRAHDAKECVRLLPNVRSVPTSGDAFHPEGRIGSTIAGWAKSGMKRKGRQHLPKAGRARSRCVPAHEHRNRAAHPFARVPSSRRGTAWAIGVAVLAVIVVVGIIGLIAGARTDGATSVDVRG